MLAAANTTVRLHTEIFVLIILRYFFDSRG